MTLLYLEITQPDLQREYRLARSQPRHLVPSTRALSPASSRANLPGLLDALDAAQHVLEMFRRSLPEGSARRLLDRVHNRLFKIAAELRNLAD
jgi:cob(I)alamin adenosyltransferase